MLTLTEVRRYSAQSGLRDMMIAEKEVVLTFLLQLLSEKGVLEKLAFKGGTCLRKMFIGSQGRFSTDLDFTALEEHDHEDVILDMMGAFEQEFHGIKCHIADDSHYETVDGLSWGVNPTYAHEWNASGESEIKLQVSRRETPTLVPVRLAQCAQSYFELLPFKPADIACLALPEILAEKIRACYQRNKARDSFDPARLMQKFEDGKDFDWEDLRDLVRRDANIDREKICADCVRGFRFLSELTPEEQTLAADCYERERALAERLRGAIARAEL